MTKAGEITREITILAPTYNDWNSVASLLPIIDRVIQQAGITAHVYLINYGSTDEDGRAGLAELRLSNIKNLSLIHLTRNMGSQRAIAVGIGYLADATDRPAKGPLIVMDSDHEDKPEDIVALLHAVAAATKPTVVFADRTRRSEGLAFRALYSLFKMTFVALTGHPLSFGNFSAIPGSMLRRLASISELWDSYPSAIIRAKLPHIKIPTS